MIKLNTKQNSKLLMKKKSRKDNLLNQKIEISYGELFYLKNVWCRSCSKKSASIKIENLEANDGSTINTSIENKKEGNSPRYEKMIRVLMKEITRTRKFLEENRN